MLKNHIIFAFRLFVKEKIYSLLNLLGLTLGITVGIILLLYMQHELNYDKHFAKYDQIYRFTNHMKADGVEFTTASTSSRLGPILKSDLPEVISFARFVNHHRPLVVIDKDGEQKQFYQENVWSTDSTVFDLFDHKALEGDLKTCLQGPGKVVLTASVAKKFFGNEKALGRMIHVNQHEKKELREVTAVISDLPKNTHLRYEMLLSEIPVIDWDKGKSAQRTSEVFWNPDAYTYLLLPENYDPQNFYEKFPGIYDKTFKLFGDVINGVVFPQIQRLDEIHFDSDKTEDQPVGNIRYVYTFAAVGLFIILLACINYMNMATARSVTRTGEMAMRKVLGYTRRALFGSVIIEAMVLAFLAAILANIVAFVVLELTPFNSLIQKDLSLNYLSNPQLLLGVVSITLIIGFISGIYPAVYIPAVPIITGLKGTFTGDRAGGVLRKILITFQFAISLFVIISTVLMDRQIDFMQSQDLGFDKDYLVLVDVMDKETENSIPAIKTELLRNPNILGVTNSYGSPGRGSANGVLWLEKDSTLQQQQIKQIYVGKDFIKTLGIEMVQGRAFNEDLPTDYYKSFLINEAGAAMMGWGDEAVGKRARQYHGNEDLKIIGVFKDFHFESLHNKIDPLLLILDSDMGGQIYIKLKGTDLEATLDYIEDIWTRFDANHPFMYTFLDQEFAKQYEADRIQQQLISILSYICILISILGLIGLSAFTASRKAKEISIRKVLGAQSGSLVMLFSRDYLKLILIAFVIAVPVSDYIIVEWLSNFAYRMQISWWYFIIPGILVLLLGLLTVAIQSLRASRANPVDGLRSE